MARVEIRNRAGEVVDSREIGPGDPDPTTCLHILDFGESPVLDDERYHVRCRKCGIEGLAFLDFRRNRIDVDPITPGSMSKPETWRDRPPML